MQFLFSCILPVECVIALFLVIPGFTKLKRSLSRLHTPGLDWIIGGVSSLLVLSLANAYMVLKQQTRVVAIAPDTPLAFERMLEAERDCYLSALCLALLIFINRYLRLIMSNFQLGMNWLCP